MSEARGGGAREWRAGDAPPLGLLRLREADIVRLCGLGAASRGLDLATRRALSQPRRDGARLSALVGTDEPAEAWIEVIETREPVERLTQADVRWGCASHTEGSHGCEHVAAVLSAWARAPGDFRSPVAPVEERPASSLAPTAAPPTAPPTPDASPIPDTPAVTAKSARAGPRAPASLTDELRRLPERELMALARRALGGDGATFPARTVEETLAALDAALRDPEALARLLARLEPDARELLAWLRLAGGALTAAGLDALAARSGRPVSALRGTLATLERHALLFPNLLPDAAPAQPGEARGWSWSGVTGWRIAPETRAALPREAPIEPLSRAEIVAERPRVEKASPRALMLALALLPRAPAPLGSPPPRDPDAGPSSERSLPHDGGSPIRRERSGLALAPEDLPEAALLSAARAAGLSPDAARLARRVAFWARDWDGAAGGASLLASAHAPAERLRAYQAAFAVWRAARSPADLMDLERITGTVRMRYDHTHEAFRPAALADEAAAGRGWVARLLGLTAPGAWYRVDDLVELVWRVNPFFLRGKQLAWRSPVWRLERVADGRPLRPDVREEWNAAEGAYLRVLQAGPLHLWGALDLALDGAGAPRLFRLTPLGRALLGRPPRDAGASGEMDAERAAAQALALDWGPAATLTREGALAVQPLATSAALLAALDQWAEVTGLAGGRLLYTFTPGRALARFDEGASPERALAPLRAAGLVRAAQTLAPRLEGWRQGYGDARLTDGLVVVEGRDEATLREALTASPGIAARARRLGPAVVALTHADATALRAALAKKGWEL
ncbi:MAG TPA: hypothetical protein VFQ25_04470 [Ktedonobacterales bacterium]|nr:hypothetical protein [Ktedonobacterales bacterium]